MFLNLHPLNLSAGKQFLYGRLSFFGVVGGHTETFIP